MGEEEIIKTKRIIISFTSSKNDGKILISLILI